MQSILVPGYRSLFGEPTQTYEDLVKCLPSNIVIALAIALNNELNVSGEEDVVNQQRLRQLVSFRYSEEQLRIFNEAYHKYRLMTGGSYKEYVFGRRYLLAMVIKELKRDAQFDIVDTSGYQEYNFLKAYLLVVDEINQKDLDILAVVKGQKDDFFIYRLIWTSYISQFQFNEKAEVPFEMMKLLTFIKFAFDNYRPFLREYLHDLKFDTIGQFLGSFLQVVQAAIHENKNEALSKLIYIKPDDKIDTSHLKSLSINEAPAGPINLPLLKKFPLFFAPSKGYMIIDHNLYMKKMYKGPYFDLYYRTSLSKKQKFNSYSSTIAKKVMEEGYFKMILSRLRGSKHDVMYFDDGTDKAPDCYGRHNKSVLLFEFKGYLFPDDFPENPDFDAIKKYIDERFVETTSGKAKGVRQLLQQIEDFVGGAFDFDKKCDNVFRCQRIDIYPVIVIDDFHFTMPAVNEYLNNQFLQRLNASLSSNYRVKESYFDQP